MEMTVCKEYIGLMPVAQVNADTMLFASMMCCCVWISEFKMLVGNAMMDVRSWVELKKGLLHKETEWKMSADALLLPLT